MVQRYNYFYQQNHFPFCLSSCWLTAVDSAWRSSHGHHIPWIKPSLHGFTLGLGSRKCFTFISRLKENLRVGRRQCRPPVFLHPCFPQNRRLQDGGRKIDIGATAGQLLFLTNPSLGESQEVWWCCFSPFPGPHSRLTDKNVHAGVRLYTVKAFPLS